MLEFLQKGKSLYHSDQKYLDLLVNKYYSEKSPKTKSINESNDVTTFADVDINEESKNETSAKQTDDDISSLKKKIDNLEKKASEIDKQEYHRNFYKSEGTTLVLSLVLGLVGLQGIGHFYVGKVAKGLGFLIGSLILLVAGFGTLDFVVGYVLIVAYFVILLWQIVDSRKLCQYYNGYVSSSGKSPW